MESRMKTQILISSRRAGKTNLVLQEVTGINMDKTQYNFSKPTLPNVRYISHTGYRIYFKIHEGEKSGFEFEIFELHGVNEDSLGKSWSEVDYLDPNADVVKIAEGIAYFDGIRHLYFYDQEGHIKSDAPAYWFYPDLNVFTALIEMERMFCSYGDSSDEGKHFTK